MTDWHVHLCFSVYLFGRLTNQWCIEGLLTSSIVVLAGNSAMIVRIDDESNENAHVCIVTVALFINADGQRDSPVVATERF